MIEMDCNDDAFAPNPGAQVAEIIRKVAEQISDFQTAEGVLLTTSGVIVGGWRFAGGTITAEGGRADGQS